MIETLVKFNERLMSLPAGVVVMLFAISLGYVLKSAQFFPNNKIPAVVVMFTAIWFPIVQFCSDQIANVAKAIWHVPLNMMLGFILGAFAWLIHAQLLKRFLDPKMFNAAGTQRDSSAPPPSNQT